MAGGRKSRRAGSGQSRRAVSEADSCFYLRRKRGLNPFDREAVDLLEIGQQAGLFCGEQNRFDAARRTICTNFTPGSRSSVLDFCRAWAGLGELFDEVVASLSNPTKKPKTPNEKRRPLRIAVVGRPNVGKSTLINRLLGFDRSVVDALPGTTRDSLDTPFEIFGRPCILVDTAGIRRKARIDDRIEHFSVNRSLRAVDGGDLIIHVIDGPEGVTDQDAQILSYAFQRGKALLLAVNKWDLVSASGANAKAYRDEVYYRLSFLDFVPVAFIAAATGHGIRKMLDTAAGVIRGVRSQDPDGGF